MRDADATASRVEGLIRAGRFEDACVILDPLALERAKKNHDADARMKALLKLLSPVIGERDRDAIKDIGWGLKTVGKYEPELLTRYPRTEMRPANPRKLMIGKATTYLSASAKREFIRRSLIS
jgi:hypothetical protein